MKDWAFMKLEGFLTPQKIGSNVTYIKDLSSDNPGIPSMRLGLGWFTQNGLPKASLTPHAPLNSMSFANIVISEVSAVYARYHKIHPATWAWYVLLEKGFVTLPTDHTLTNTRMLNRVTPEMFTHLLQKYTTQEVFFLVLAGVEKDPENWIEALREMRETFPEKTYDEALPYIRLGAEPDVLIENLRLPFHVVQKIYS